MNPTRGRRSHTVIACTVGHAALDDAHDDYTDSDDDDDDILPRSKLSRGASSRASLRSGGVGGVLRGGAGAAGAGASAAAGRGGKSSKEDEGGDGSEAAGGSTPDIVSARQRHSIGLAYQALRQHDKALHNFMAALVEDPTHVRARFLCRAVAVAAVTGAVAGLSTGPVKVPRGVNATPARGVQRRYPAAGSSHGRGWR